MHHLRFFRSLSIVAAAGLLSVAIHGQISQPGQPVSDWAVLPDAPTVVLETPDIEAMKVEDDERNHWPLRYGAVIETSHGLEDSGVWHQVADDASLVWRLKIHSPGALSLGVVFSEYEVPVGGQVFLYNGAKSTVLGAYTDFNNNVNGLLGVEPVPGDTVVIEYVQQVWVQEPAKLTVGEVIHDYRDVFDLLLPTTGPGEGSPCLVDINCPAGAPYQTVKRAVIRTLSGGSLCSGAILNNTAQDGTPFMLSANHCGSMTAGVFLFNYENTGCTGFGATTGQTVSGATQIAASSGFDSRLWRLNSQIPTAYNPYYAGWSRLSSSGAPAAAMGHGGGAPKQIAIDNNGATLSGSDFRVTWNTGITIGGNSGGPLVDSNMRVIGPACCVTNFNCGSQTVFFGRFGGFWGVGAVATNLDPIGTGQSTLSGFDPFAVPPVITGISPGTVEVFGSGPVTLTGSGFLGADTVNVGATVLSSGSFTVVDDTTITFGPPQPATFGTVSVDVVKTVGTSNPVNLTYVETDPPKLTATGIGVTGLGFAWNFGGGQDDLFFLFAQVNDGSTIPFMGFNLLASPIFLSSGSLSSIGVGQVGTTVPTGLVGAQIHSQVITLDDITFGFVGGSNAFVSTILI